MLRLAVEGEGVGICKIQRSAHTVLLVKDLDDNATIVEYFAELDDNSADMLTLVLRGLAGVR